MKTSIFIPLAAEYDPDEPRFKGMFDLSDAEIRDLLTRIHREHVESSDDEDERSTAVDLFMRELQEHRVSHSMILFFACYGLKTMFKENSAGMSLYYYGDKEDQQRSPS